MLIKKCVIAIFDWVLENTAEILFVVWLQNKEKHSLICCFDLVGLLRITVFIRGCSKVMGKLTEK